MSPTKTTKAKRKPATKKKSSTKSATRKPARGKVAAGKAKVGKASKAGKAGGPVKKRKLAAKRPARKKTLPGAPKPSAPPAENPAAQALARKIAGLCLDKKAKDVVILDVRGIASYADYVVLASGESDRQVSAIGENIQKTLKDQDGQRVVGAEGTETGQWVLLDYGDVVTHLFYDEARPHYDLEGLWADAPRETVR